MIGKMDWSEQNLSNEHAYYQIPLLSDFLLPAYVKKMRWIEINNLFLVMLILYISAKAKFNLLNINQNEK